MSNCYGDDYDQDDYQLGSRFDWAVYVFIFLGFVLLGVSLFIL